MKLFILKTGILGGIVVLFLVILYLIIPVKSNDYLMAYKQKCRLLEEIPSPRIIFVGGSNLAFGLDSERIQDSLNINVINYGLQAGIGLKYMLDDVSSYVRKGDIVVFAPEWSQFYTVMYGEGRTFATILRIVELDKINHLNINQIINVLKGLPGSLSQFIIPSIQNDRSYLASNFNYYGDEVKHWTLESIAISNPQPIKKNFDEQFGEYFIFKLKELQTRCHVYMIPPVCRNKAFELWHLQVEEVTHFLEDEGFPFLICPDSCALSDEYFYDTDYHLNKKGVDLRTGLVIEALKPYVIEVNK